VAKISQDCIKEAFDALKHFSKDDLEDYVRSVFIRAKEIDPLQGARSMDAAAKEINEQALKNFFADATQKAKNIMAFEANSKPIKDGKADMRGVLAGRQLRKNYWKRTDKDSSWRKRNIPDAIKAEYEKVIQRITGDLSHEELEHFSSGDFDEEICDVVGGKETKNPLTRKIADKIKDYWDYSKTQLILSGAMKPDEFHPKRFFSAIHDQQRIINGSKSMIKIALEKKKGTYDLRENKVGWRNYIKQFLDLNWTFRNTDAMDLEGNLNAGEMDKIIDRTFDNITSGKSNIFTRSVVANDREAVARKSKMFFVWKNLRAQYEYNKTYGRGNLFAMLMGDAQSMSNKVGTAKMWGDNPYSMYNDLRKVQEEVDPKGGKWWEHTDNYFKSVMKLDRLNESPNATNFFANLRTLSTMARLPLITLDSISDIGYVSSFAQRIGVNYFQAWGHHLGHLFDTFPTENRARIAKLLKTQTDSHLGYMGRWTETNNATDWLNKISTSFFKRNLLEAFDRGNKTGNMTLMAESFGGHANKSWNDLPEQARKYLDRFIDDKEWDLLRKKNNGGLFTTENVDNLTDSELRSHYQSTDKSIPLSDLRDDLYRRVYAMFATNAENTVLAPGDFERAFLFQGTNPGETKGILLRMFSQFKMYTLSYIDRVLIDGLRGADSTQQKIVWATTMLMGTLPLSYASMFLKYRLMGLTMPDPSKMNVPEREKYLMSLLAPSLGIFAGMLDARNQNSSMVLSLLGSPSISLIGNALSVPLALATGDPKKAAKQLVKSANYLAPIQTTPIISPIIRQAMGDEAHLEPGQQHLFGR
jgi:hypothetical protein